MNVLKTVGGALGALLLLVLVWGVLIEPRFLLDVRDEEAPIPGLPAAWEGQRVALLADFQVGMWFDNTGMVREAIEEAIERNPALVLIAGDFVYKPDSAVVREAVGYVRPLVEAGVPTYAVLGNHDYGIEKESSAAHEEIVAYLEERLEAAGISVLRNEATRVERDGAPLYVAGIDSEWAERSRPGAAMAGVPDAAPRIVLMHNPVTYRDLPPDTAPLTLAAHTHGGQIRIPFTPSESWLDIARSREVVADGWADASVGAEGNHLYVNRGVGFSIVPMRLRCRPELTVFTLRQAGEASETTVGGVPVAPPGSGPARQPAG